MKKGDTFPVTIQGITVTQAVVEAVESDRVTLMIPGTRAVVGITVSLSDSTPTSGKETIIDGVVDTSISSEDVEEPTAATTAAPEPVQGASPEEVTTPSENTNGTESE